MTSTCENSRRAEYRNKSEVRVLLADDHALVRAGFRALLHELGLAVTAEASNGEEALEQIQLGKPDLTLMDIGMPKLNGLEATARALEVFPGARIIILSMHANIEYARRAMLAGAMGYLLKNSSTAELKTAIQTVLQGEVYLSPPVAKYIAADYLQMATAGEHAPGRLTNRQLNILKLIAKGYSRKQVAEELNISVKTYDTYRSQILQQLGIHDVAGLVRYATRIGLVTPDD